MKCIGISGFHFCGVTDDFDQSKSSVDDQPALVTTNGTKIWIKDGKIHRDGDKPALIEPDRSYHFKNGEIHRETGPAAIYNDGTNEYYLNGVHLSKEDWEKKLLEDPTVLTKTLSTLSVGDFSFISGTKIWFSDIEKTKVRKSELSGRTCTFKDNKRHSYDDQPAIITKEGNKEWFLEGERHRTTGPARIVNGEETYWLNDMSLNKNQWQQRTSNYPGLLPIGNRKFAKVKCVEYSDAECSNPIKLIDYYGNVFKFKNCTYHCDEKDSLGNVLPAIEWKNGTKEWLINEKRHREDGPAIIYGDGAEIYYLDDEFLTKEKWQEEIKNRKCQGAPTMENKSSEACAAQEIKPVRKSRLIVDDHPYPWTEADVWYSSPGVIGRENDLPAIVENTAGKCSVWVTKNVIHRSDDLPALVWGNNDERRWYSNGELHRVAGPAICRTGYERYYVNGIEYSKEDWLSKYTKKEESFRFNFWNLENARIYYESLDDDGKPAIIGKSDGPAIVCDDGTEVWAKNGKLHRLDGPAIVKPNGTEYWYVEGKLHRENDLPAIKRVDGREEWWVEGVLHREAGKPAISDPKNNYFMWSEHNKFIRESGPACINGNVREWYVDNKKRNINKALLRILTTNLTTQASNRLFGSKNQIYKDLTAIVLGLGLKDSDSFILHHIANECRVGGMSNVLESIIEKFKKNLKQNPSSSKEEEPLDLSYDELIEMEEKNVIPYSVGKAQS